MYMYMYMYNEHVLHVHCTCTFQGEALQKDEVAVVQGVVCCGQCIVLRLRQHQTLHTETHCC